MPLNSNALIKITDRFRAPAGAPKKDPRAAWKWVIGGLAVANVAAFFLLVRPPGGTVSDLEEQLRSLRQQAAQQRLENNRAKLLVEKMGKATSEQEGFLQAYFMDRRTTSSTILAEIARAAREAGLKPKEHSFTFEGVDGSDTIEMLTISASYEGEYGQLVRFVNEVDRSKRFLIIDSIQAAPMQEKNRLSARFKMNAFVRVMGGPVAVEAVGQ